jgi:hypothetical protein
MGPIGCHATSVRNYHCTLYNIPEESRYQQQNFSGIWSRRLLINIFADKAINYFYLTGQTFGFVLVVMFIQNEIKNIREEEM